MRTRTTLISIFLGILVNASACGPGFLYETSGSFGVEFKPDSGCVTLDVSDVKLKAPYSFAVYLYADEEPGDLLLPIVVWPGSFALYRDEDGQLVLGWETGAAKVTNAIMDGAYHHVAWTNDTGGGTRLYLDGENVFTGQVNLLGNPASSLYLGCWPAENANFSGVIGEAAFFKQAQWTTNFVPSWTEHDVTDDTLSIWRLNEGRGDAVIDVMKAADGTLDGGSWVPFTLNGEKPEPE